MNNKKNLGGEIKEHNIQSKNMFIVKAFFALFIILTYFTLWIITILAVFLLADNELKPLFEELFHHELYATAAFLVMLMAISFVICVVYGKILDYIIRNVLIIKNLLLFLKKE